MPKMICERCHEEFYYRWQPNPRRFCSKTCAHIVQLDQSYHNYIERWFRGEENGMKGKTTKGFSNHVKRWIRERAEDRCEICGWDKVNPFTNKKPLEIHHIDGNWEHTVPNNLQLICPNCHSLTETYKARGKGRPFRS